MAHNRLRVGLAALMLGAAAFGLAGCGRAGPTELPPGGPGLGWGFGLPSVSAAPPAGAAVSAAPPNASAAPPAGAASTAPPPNASAEPAAGAAPSTAPPAASAAPPQPGETALNQAVPGAPAQTNTVKNGFDTAGNPIAPPGQKKPFLLDPILQ